MKSEAKIGIAISLLIVLFSFFTVKNYQSKINKQVITKKAVTTDQPATILNLEEITKHNKTEDCWIIIDNKVYDLSNYADLHPGGVGPIADNCGKDGTNIFNDRNGKGPHPAKANENLISFYIGNLNGKKQDIQNNTKQTLPVKNKKEKEEDNDD